MSIKGGLSEAVKGNTYQNIANNGNFANGTTNWNHAPGGTIASNDNTLVVTADGTQINTDARQTTNVKFSPSGKIYVRAKMRVTNANCTFIKFNLFGDAGMSRYVGTQANPVSNQWYIISGIFTNNVPDVGDIKLQLQQTYPDAATANGKVMEVQEVMSIDLTSAGLDALTVDQCNQRFPNWFDGVKSIISMSNTLKTVNL
jgi:hypothetical protein